MGTLTGLVAMVALVLAASGVLKLADGQPTLELLRALGLPGGRAAVSGLGLAEVLLAVAVLAVGGPVATLGVAALYTGFAGLVALALRRAPAGVSCGCFGRHSAPPSRLHLAVNAGSAAVALAAGLAGAPPLADVLAEQPLAGVPMLGLVVLGASLLIVITTVLADALDAARPAARSASAVPTFHIRAGGR